MNFIQQVESYTEKSLTQEAPNLNLLHVKVVTYCYFRNSGIKLTYFMFDQKKGYKGSYPRKLH